MNWCILIPAIVGIISALLGYLLGKLLGKSNTDGDHNKISILEADLASCRSRSNQIEAELESYKSGNTTHNSLTSSNTASDNSQLIADLSASKSKVNELEAEVSDYKAKYESLRNSSINDTGDIDKYREQISKLETDLRLIKSKSSVLENDLETCKMDKVRLESDLMNAQNNASNNIGNLATGLAATAATIAFDADAAKAVFGKKIKQDDLKLVEGIGPKIEQLFHDHNVKTWKALSECSQEKCKDVLKSGGKRFEMHKPGTWPKQAKLAYEGKWQELFDWQEELDGGKL